MKAMKKYLRELGAEIEEAIESGSMSESDIASNCENWLTIHKFCECYGKMKHGGVHHAVHDSADENENWLLESIGDELDEASDYYGKWTETGNETFKTLAKDELGHGETLMQLAKHNPIAPIDADLLHSLEALRMELSGKLL